MDINSKLPQVGTNIFSVMSQLASQHNALNLSQGFPDFDCSPNLIELVNKFMNKGFNQYAPMIGVKELREGIAKKMEDLHHAMYDVEKEITVTSGGSEALFSAIASTIHPGDEVIIFEPAYDLYHPTVKLFGGIPKTIQLLSPDFIIDWNEVRNKISSKTKMIILNNPNNPATSVLTDHDFKELIKIVENTNIFLISDEVYEHIIFDGSKHISVSQYPELKKRAFVVASFGKLYHITGWKIGYCLAPEFLMNEFRKVHQFNVFCVNTAIQYALAEFLKRKEEYLELSPFFQQKRDFFIEGLNQTPFKVIQPKGTYFLLANYSKISDLNELEFSKWLTEKH